MANEEHLAKLQEGVEAWNKWRTENSDIKPDLSRANLEGSQLKYVNFDYANLFLSDLDHANLEYAQLNYANLGNANIGNANLEKANLYDANLQHAIFYDTNLYRAHLNYSNLDYAILTGTDLCNSELFGVNLTGANLTRVQALGTRFENATLTGACIKDWNINSQTNFKNVKCDYIYLKAGQQDRIPHDLYKRFAPGEFTKRYQKILETVNLYFGKGIDWQVFLNSFQKLQEEEKIKITEGDREIPIVQGIENTGDGSFIIKIGVSPDTEKGEIEKSFWQKYQPMLEAKEEQIKFFHEELTIKRQENTKLIKIIETMAEKDNSTYNDNRNIQINEGNYNEKIKGNFYEHKGNFRIGHMSDGTISGNAKVSGVNDETNQQDQN